VQQLEAFGIEQNGHPADARDISAGPVHAGNEAVRDRIGAGLENDGYSRGCRFGRQAGGGGAAGGNDIDVPADQVGH
jgi:hypothetical protein